MTMSWKKQLPTISTRQHNPARQYANAKSKEMLSSTVFRAESSLFSPRECRRLPPLTVSSLPLITRDKIPARRDMLCPYSKIKLTKLPLNNYLDKLLPPLFLISMVYIYILIYILIGSYEYLYIYVQNPYKQRTSLYHQRTDINKCSTCSINLKFYT